MKHFITLCILSILCSCEGITPKETDYKSLTKEEEIKKIVSDAFSKVGDNITKLDEIDIRISRPSKEGTIKIEEPDYLSMTVHFLDPEDPKRLYEYLYYSKEGGWRKGESKEVNLLGGNKETFVLANEVFDASTLTPDFIAKTVLEGWNKYKDETKYSDQWVTSISIKEKNIEVGVRGILSANNLEKTEYFKKKY